MIRVQPTTIVQFCNQIQLHSSSVVGYFKFFVIVLYISNSSPMIRVQRTTTVQFCLRNRKHFPCFYRVIETRVEVWENEKCCGNTSRRRVFPQPFRVLPNLHECFYNSMETRRKCFLFLLENSPRKITKNEENFIVLFIIKT